MATTTNYGWTTPDDTDLVKDGASAIRTLGSSADTTVKALSPGTTAGDVDYYTSGTAKARLAIGTAGQVLQVNSGATAPEWATPASGGMTLLSTTSLSTGTTTISSISGSYTDLKIYIVGYVPSVDNGDCSIRVNSDTGSNYGVVSALGQAAVTTGTSIGINDGLDNVVDDNLFVIEMPLYSNTTSWKQIRSYATGVDSTAGTAFRIKNVFVGYKSTSAISSVTIFCSSGTMAGTVYIYGVN
jgi:hypothetical protein